MSRMDKRIEDENEEKYLAFPRHHSLSTLDLDSVELGDTQKQTLSDSERISQKESQQIVDEDPQRKEPKNRPPRSAGYPKSIEVPIATVSVSTQDRDPSNINDILKKRMIERQQGIAAQQRRRQNGGHEKLDESWLKLSSIRDPSLLKPVKGKKTPYPKEPLRISDYEESSGVDESIRESKETKTKIPNIFAKMKSRKSSEVVAKNSNKHVSENRENKEVDRRSSTAPNERSSHDPRGTEKPKGENEKHDTDKTETKELRGNKDDENDEDNGEKRHTMYGEHVHDPWLPKVKPPKNSKKRSCPMKKLFPRKKSEASKKTG